MCKISCVNILMDTFWVSMKRHPDAMERKAPAPNKVDPLAFNTIPHLWYAFQLWNRIGGTEINSVVYRGGSSHFFGNGIYRYQVGSVFGIFIRYPSTPFLYHSPFFLKRGAGLLKKGAVAPLLRKKGGHFPPFEEKRGPLPPFWYQNVPAEFSVGISMVNTKKYWPIPTNKYQFGIQL